MTILAQIGCGYWGPNLLRNFSALPGARVKYVVEASEARRRYVETHYPTTRAVSSLDAVYGDPAVNAIVVATPAQTHFPLALQALQSGRHVFVEKPLAMTVTDVDSLAALAAKQGLTLMVGHTFLYNPAVLFLKQLIESGELGRIYYLYAQRLNLGVVRTDVNALWNLAPHDVSIFNFLLGATPTAVVAHGTDYLQKGVEDVVFAHLEYPGEVRANLHVSWLDPNKVRKVTLVGSRKMVVYDDVADDKLVVFDKGIDSPIPAGADLPFDQSAAGSKLVYRSGDFHVPQLPAVEPLREEAAAFIEAIASGRSPRSGAESGRNVVAALQAAALSLKENSRRVRLDEIVPAPAGGRG
jgi:predicted dehydrogenase